MKHTPQQLHEKHEAPKLHEPVLLSQVEELLAPRPGETYLDLTAGYGGHARAIAARLGGFQTVTLIDRDEHAIRELEMLKQAGASVIQDDFASFAERSAREGKAYDMVLVDFGVSSPQLDRAERGFSINRSGPLDMRMDQRQEKTAFSIANSMSEAELARLIAVYGEERPRRASAIARAIVRARPIRTTGELAAAVLSTHRGPHQKVHPATRTFQAIRIAINDEIGQIERLLAVADRILNPGGRIVFISFHSLEDRLVKRYLKEQADAGYESELSLLRPRAILGKIYDVHNPRARSASLRAAVKNKKKG